MDSTFSIEAAFPPSLEGQPLLGMLTVMSFWVVTLLCLRWTYETLDQQWDNPAPEGSYVRLARRVRFWKVGACLVMTAPRLGQLMLWQVMSPDWREIVAVLAWVVCIPAACMIFYAWWIDRLLVKTESAYTSVYGFYTAAKSTTSEKRRGVLILTVIFAIAFCTTFVRPREHVDLSPSAVAIAD